MSRRRVHRPRDGRQRRPAKLLARATRSRLAGRPTRDGQAGERANTLLVVAYEWVLSCDIGPNNARVMYAIKYYNIIIDCIHYNYIIL